MSEVDIAMLQKRGGKGWKIALAIAIVALLAGAAVWFFAFRASEEPIKYITAPLKRQDLKVTVQATGNLEPLRTVNIGIEVSGTLKEVLVDYNDRVKVGEVLARLDTTKLESSLLGSRAQMRIASANVQSGEVAAREAKLQLDRLKSIFASTKGDYPSQKDMDAAQASYDKAVAALTASKAQLEQAQAEVSTGEENLRKAVVVSPINGTVLTREVDPGQTVAASMQTPTLFTIAEDLSMMQVVVAVDEADVGEVREGQAVTFTVNAYPDREFNGTVKQVRLGSQITSGVVTYDTVVRVDNSNGLLRPGMTAQASIISKMTKGALVAPNAAFRFVPPASGAMPPMMGVPRGMRPPSAKDSGAKLYLLQNGEPKMMRVERGDTDGTVSAVSAVRGEDGGELKEGAVVITGVQAAVK